jgi:hypothetical protein
MIKRMIEKIMDKLFLSDDAKSMLQTQEDIAEIIKALGMPAPEPGERLHEVMAKIKAAIEYLIERKKRH